jgi:hypothetical protein
MECTCSCGPNEGQPTQVDDMKDFIPFFISGKHAFTLEELIVSSSCSEISGTVCKAPTAQSDFCAKHKIKYDQNAKQFGTFPFL